METSKMTTKGRIVIPSKIRKKYHTVKGTRIRFIEKEDKVVLEPVTPEFVKSLRGSLKGTGIVQALLDERKKDKENSLILS